MAGDGVLRLGVLGDALAHLPGEVQALTVLLEDVQYAQRLVVVPEAARKQLVQYLLAGVAERRVPEVVRERDRLGQVLIQVQRPRDRARDLHDLDRMGQTS